MFHTVEKSLWSSQCKKLNIIKQVSLHKYDPPEPRVGTAKIPNESVFIKSNTQLKLDFNRAVRLFVVRYTFDA